MTDLKNATKLTLDSLIDLAYDPYLPGADLLISGLLDAAKNSELNNVKIKAAIALLKNWDFKVSETSIGMTLAQFYLNTYLK